MITRFYNGPLKGHLLQLQNEIVQCKACPRLVEYRERKALTEKRAGFSNCDYWGAPVPSHGDQNAKLLIVGLAPGAHGANRTGRLFTGDPSANFLTQALHTAAFSNQPSSSDLGDGLKLNNVFLSSALHCAPPNDKPLTTELKSCEHFLHEEMHYLPTIKAILTLGHIAFNQTLKVLSSVHKKKLNATFIHGAEYHFEVGLPRLFISYHPSPRNTNTGRLSQGSIDSILRRINDFLDSSN